MFGQKRVTDACRWHLEDLAARVVAESGRACDRFHLGKLILQGLKDAPEFTLQINGSTGESETFGSVLERSVKCANAFRELGLKHGDVIVLMAPNDLNLCIPFYAALYLGVLVAPIDRLLKIKELKDMFTIDEPKIVFCQNERVDDVQTALHDLKLDAKIVTHDEYSGNQDKAISLDKLLKKYGSETDVQDFKPSDFDPEDSIALLMSTSGTTGLPKQAANTHKNFVITGGVIWSRFTTFPTPFKIALIVSPLQWLTAILHFYLAPIMRYTMLMTPIGIDKHHFYDLLKYKPNQIIISPTMLSGFVVPDTKDKCDFSSFELITIGGSAVSPDLLKDVKKLATNAEVCIAYGLSEATSVGFMWGASVLASVGNPVSHLQYRLIDVDTQEDIIMKPNTQGELWIKGPSVCKGYYKNAEVTKVSFTEDGWFKTGDLFYRDEHYNFFFIDRMKLLLKYSNHQISPAEIQNVILQHPAVLDVAVTGIDDKLGDLPVACVVRKPGYNVTAQEIKDLVKECLTDTKQLRGGVVFMDKIPVTATTKLDYRRLKQMVLQMARE